MIRYFYVLFINILRIPYYMCKAEYMLRHAERYTEEERYALDIKVINILKRTGGITTHVIGQYNLPKKGGCYKVQQPGSFAAGLLTNAKTKLLQLR